MGLETSVLNIKIQVVGRSGQDREKLITSSALKEKLQTGGYEGQSQCKSNLNDTEMFPAGHWSWALLLPTNAVRMGKGIKALWLLWSKIAYKILAIIIIIIIIIVMSKISARNHSNKHLKCHHPELSSYQRLETGHRIYHK